MERSEENGKNSRHPELWDEPDHIRKEITRTMGQIYSQGMTTTSGGNISVIDSLGNVWITPSGTDKGSLKPGEVICVAPDGSFEGQNRPSMEYQLHRAVYDARPDIRALIHAHPPMLTSFSIVHRAPDASLLREWRELCGTVGYAGYATPGSDIVGEKVASEFRKGYDAVIMENHAIVTGGKDLSEALARLEALENCATTIHAAGSIGEVLLPEGANMRPDSGRGINNTRPGHELATGERVTFPDPGKKDHLLNPEEELIAEDICRLAARGCSRGLMYGFSGVISSRGDGKGFLITGKRVLRSVMGKADIVRVGNGTLPGTGSPGNTEWLHAEIYRRFPSVNAVITSQPPYLMAFAVTGKAIDVRTIPESWLLLNQVSSVPVEALHPGREEVFDRLAGGSPVVLIMNDSVIVTGDSLLQAFDRLEVAEMTAMSLVFAPQLGKVQPINEKQIADLGKAFLKE